MPPTPLLSISTPAEDLGGQPALRIKALLLLVEVDPGESQGLDLLGRFRIDLALEVDVARPFRDDAGPDPFDVGPVQARAAA